MKRRLLLVLVLLTALLPQNAYVQTPTEYELKAVFLYNFTQFVDWPEQAFESAGSPVVIGLLGSDPFGDVLRETIQNEKVRGRPLIIQHHRSLSEVAKPQILFVSREREDIDQILQSMRGHPVLTVSDAPDFAERGGVIAFKTVENHVRIRINLTSAQEAGLTVSSKLLRVSETIQKE